MPVSHSVCTQIPQKGDIWTAKGRHRTNTEKTVCTERRGDIGSECNARPYPYVGEHTAIYKHSTVYGIYQGQKYADDI